MSGDFGYRSLFVSDLPPDVTETTLLNAFCTSGTIISVRIVRNKESRQSLGYGYVNFLHESEARNVLNTKNFMEINGKQIRLTAAQSDPNLRKRNNTNVFVKNLDKSVDNKRLHEAFKRFGTILSSKLAKEANGQSKGFGFIQFESEQNAMDAIIAMNGRLLDGKIVFCCKFLPKSERQKYMRNGTEVKRFANIYVKNLNPELDDNALMQMFITFGSVIAVKVFQKNSKRFGFVCFEDSVNANKAIKTLNGKPLPNGCALHVSPASKSIQKKVSTNRLAKRSGDGHDIYIKYLDQSIDNRKLVEVFSPFGQITGSMTHFPLGLYWPSDGFGFICFSSPESAQKAVQQMNNTILSNKSLFVSIAKPLKEPNKGLTANPFLKPKGMSHWKRWAGYPKLKLN